MRAIDSAHGNQARHSCKRVAPPTHISRMKLPPTKAILGHRSTTILTGWRWICLTEGLRCASCSSSGQKLPPRPNGMLPHSDLFHGSVTNLILSWSSSLKKQWGTSLRGRSLRQWGRKPFNRVKPSARRWSSETDSLTWWALGTCGTNRKRYFPCSDNFWDGSLSRDWFTSLT